MSALEIIGAGVVGLGAVSYFGGIAVLSMLAARYEIFDGLTLRDGAVVVVDIVLWPVLVLWWALRTAAELVRRAVRWPV